MSDEEAFESRKDIDYENGRSATFWLRKAVALGHPDAPHRLDELDLFTRKPMPDLKIFKVSPVSFVEQLLSTWRNELFTARSASNSRRGLESA